MEEDENGYINDKDKAITGDRYALKRVKGDFPFDSRTQAEEYSKVEFDFSLTALKIKLRLKFSRYKHLAQAPDTSRVKFWKNILGIIVKMLPMVIPLVVAVL